MKLGSLLTKRGRGQVFSKKRIAKKMLYGSGRKKYSSNNNKNYNKEGSSSGGCYTFFKWAFIIFVVVPVIMGLFISIFFTDSIEYTTTYNINQDVNFRTESTVESEILRVLEKDENVILLDSLNNWYKIQDQSEMIGFVSKKYVSKEITVSGFSNQENKGNSPLIGGLFLLGLFTIWLSYKAYKNRCIHCGKRCRVFTSAHKKCSLKNSESREKIRQEVEKYFDRFNEKDFKNVDENYSDKEFSQLEFIAEEGFVNLYFILTRLLDQKVEQFLDDGVLTQNEESFLGHFIQQFNIEQETYIDSFKIKHKIVKASILRDLYDGNPMKSRIKLDGSLPFKFLNKEYLVYLDNYVDYFEKRIKTTYEGGSDGVSIKLMKGVYYRKSSFRGKPVKTLKTVPVGNGTLALTNKHLYFSSTNKNFRIRLDRIVTVTPYEDGIGIQKDGVSSKPMIFSNIDGWFYYNFIQNSDNIVESLSKSETRLRKISQTVKDRVWNRDQGKCVECGSNEKLEFDHIIPFSKGGSNTYRNIQLLCEACNRSKSNQIG
tara:strand:- start:416 stop:2041 length:1626 start_codon:yes stop_codon:yes gene_type:complete